MNARSKTKKQVKGKNPDPSVTKRRNFINVAFILVITAIVFSGSISNDFINLDDPQYVTQNSLIRNLDFESISQIFSGFTHGHYQPLSVLTYALDYQIWGMNASGFHVTSLILHLVNIILVYFLVMALCGRIEVAAIAAILFAIHPLKVESVAWISERKDVLYGLFFLASLFLYIKYIKSNRKIKFLVFSGLSFLLALFAKSMAVTLPVIMVLIDIYLDNKTWKKRIPEKIPFFILSIIFGLIAIRAQQSADLIESSLAGYSLLNRAALIFYALSIYIIKFFYPGNMLFMTDYPDMPGGMLPVIYYLSPLFIAAIIFAIYKSRKFRNDLLFGSLFFLLTIAPVLQVIPVSGYLWDHYTYIPFLGIAFIIGMFYIRVIDHQFSYSTKIRSPLRIILVAGIIILAIITWNRTGKWKNSLTIFTYVSEKQADNEAAFLNLGIAKSTDNNYQGALADFSKAIELKPNYASAYHHRGSGKEKSGDLQGALADLNKAIELRPDYAQDYIIRGLVKGRLGEHTGAIADFNKAISINPGMYDAYYNLGQAYAYAGQFHEALTALDHSIRLAPDYDIAWAVRGSVKYQMGKLEAACSDWQRAGSLGNKQAEGLAKKYCR